MVLNHLKKGIESQQSVQLFEIAILENHQRRANRNFQLKGVLIVSGVLQDVLHLSLQMLGNIDVG